MIFEPTSFGGRLYAGSLTEKFYFCGGSGESGCYGDGEATEAAKAHAEEPWREAAAQTRLRGFSAGWDVSGARGGRATPSP